MGTLLNPDYVSHAFHKILDRNNLEIIRFHDLRHSCASMLLANRYKYETNSSMARSFKL